MKYFYALIFFSKKIYNMFKKFLFIALSVTLSASVFAQKAKVNEAIKELEKAQTAEAKSDQAAATEAYQKAKAAIDAAMTDESTKANAKTLFTKAGIYLGMQNSTQLNADNPYKEGIHALKEAMTLDKKYEKEGQTYNLLANAAFYFYNDGISTYNRNEYDAAYNLFKEGADLLGPDKDKRFMLMPVIDTIRAQSRMFMGYTSFYDGKYDVALPLLEEAKTSTYLTGQESNIYMVLAQVYEKTGKTEAQLAILKEGKEKFPNDKNLANMELNYYINSGKQEEMVAKLEEAIAKDPANPELPFNLGIVYEGMAKPTTGAAPANATELMNKAEAAYKKAAGLAPDNGNYAYQYGAFFFNQAAEISKDMNNLGTSKAEQAKYNQLKTEQDVLFEKALPLLEKSEELFSGKKASLQGSELDFYRQTLEALRNIYTTKDMEAKATAVREKLKGL